MLSFVRVSVVYQFCFFYVLFMTAFHGFCYKPVFLVHGILSKNNSMGKLAQRIEEMHSGTTTLASERFLRWTSLEHIWRQIEKLGEDFQNMSNSNPDGFHLIGYSQGGLIARGLLEMFSDHNVDTFISLSSPQAGQYGDAFLRLIFPDLVCSTAYELFYSKMGQRISVANYWNDPYHQKLYFKYNLFLPFLNNAIASNRSEQFKEGITRLKKMVLIGGPDDGVITPWQSSHFGYFADNGTDIVNLTDRDIYINDKIGLRTLDSQKKLEIFELKHISHFNWHKNHSVIDNYILPYLD